MKKNFTYFCFLALFQIISARLQGQDTFSIVAIDPTTGEVGSAGASCISASNLAQFFPGIDPDFLGDLLPGVGAINTQASYLAQNQINARNRLLMGQTPQQVVDWLAFNLNDAQSNATQRQYGVAAFIDGQTQAAAYTGVNCMDYKSHRVGPNYSIQGNILLGAQILDSMEARFLNSSGCLSDRLMAALQGAKVPGADTRCLNNGTSAMFAFIKVAKPADDAANPSLRMFVSFDPVGIEPIDSLQALYDAASPCTSPAKEVNRQLQFNVGPNPTTGEVTLWTPALSAALRLDVFNPLGILQFSKTPVVSGETLHLGHSGIYYLRLYNTDGGNGMQKIIVRQ